MDMTEEQAKIGRWLAIANRVGSNMTYWVLTESGKVIARSTVQHITTTDMATDAMKTRVATFDEHLLTRLDDENFQLALPNHVLYLQDDAEVTNEPDLPDIPPATEYGDMLQDIPPATEFGDMLQDPKSDADDIEFDTFDQYLGAEFLVNSNGETAMATVTKHVKDNDGNAVGKRNANPLLDTREYECTLEDGSGVYHYNANVIADYIYSQCDNEGRSIAGNCRPQERQNCRGHNEWLHVNATRARIPKTTTKGWKLLCQWRDGSSDWIDLKHVKDSNPIQLAEYAIANRIQEEPAFKWWVSETLRTRNRIIAKVKSRYWKTCHKYGVRLPHSVQEALQIDKETGTDFWWKAIQKEMKKVMVAFEFDEGLTPDQVRQNKGSIRCVSRNKVSYDFRCKMDLTWKARFVAGGHMTEAPASLTYSSVVSRDSV